MQKTRAAVAAMHGEIREECGGRLDRCTRRSLLAKIAITASAAILVACTDHVQPPIATNTPAQPRPSLLPTVTPQTPPECVLGLWPPTTNLNPNGGFESSTAGYTVDGGTLALSTDIARFGMRSAKVVATAPSVSVTTSIIAPPFARTVYTSSVWIYATASVVGKSFFLTMTEGGGITPIAEMGQRATAIAAGWQRLFVTGPLTQPDRTQVTLSVTLPNAATNDTFYLDGWQWEPTHAPTPYLETNGATLSREVTPLTAPATTLDAVQGWVAARLRTGYSESNAPGTPRLFRWYDNERKLLDVRYDKGVWKLRRSTAAVVEEAGFPVSRPSGSVVTIVAAWTAAGPLMSVDGGLFRAPVFWDNFKRADTATGLGTAPGGNAWQLTGEGAQHTRIANGRLVCDPGHNVYAYAPLPITPSRLSGAFSLAGAANGSAAVIASQTPFLARTVLCSITRTASALGVTDIDGNLTTLKTIGYRPLAADGTVYTVGMDFNPDHSLDFESPDGQAVHLGPDERIGAHLGNLACWQLGAGAGENNWQWESVSAECPTDAPATRIDLQPHIAAPTYDIGSSRGTADFLYSDLFWFASGTGTLTSADTATLAGFGNPAPTMAQLHALNDGAAQPTMMRAAAPGETSVPCR